METTLRAGTKPEGEAPTIVIEPTKGLASLGLRDVWAYRELLGCRVVLDDLVAIDERRLFIFTALPQ